MANTVERTDVIKRINREELAELTKSLVDIPSPTGSEKAIGEFILDWFACHSIKAVRQEINPERVNAIGMIGGSANGVSLMINGHMDTSYTGTEETECFAARSNRRAT